ncbi:hypothetical protein, partial [Xanthomonas sp. GPE 39]|uniref:hypothetical protein n=1 Tax=Xanthomonas sp. GPE 39 TaxID=1583099 RepID=UPI001F3962A5
LRCLLNAHAWKCNVSTSKFITRSKLVIEPYVLGTHRKGGFFESKKREPGRSFAGKRNLLVGLEFLKRYAPGLRSKEKAAPGRINFEMPENWSPAQFFGFAVAMLDLEKKYGERWA